MLDSMRHRSGSVFPYDAWRSAPARFPETCSAAFNFLSRLARGKNENVCQWHQFGDIPDGHTETNQNKNQQTCLLRWQGYHRRASCYGWGHWNRRCLPTSEVLLAGWCRIGANSSGVQLWGNAHRWNKEDCHRNHSANRSRVSRKTKFGHRGGAWLISRSSWIEIIRFGVNRIRRCCWLYFWWFCFHFQNGWKHLSMRTRTPKINNWTVIIFTNHSKTEWKI